MHAVEVVLNKAGTAYISVTDDNGTSPRRPQRGHDHHQGGHLLGDLRDAHDHDPLGRDGDPRRLVELARRLSAGDHVSISSSSEGTNVFATDSSFKTGEGKGPMGGAPPQGGQPPSQG